MAGFCAKSCKGSPRSPCRSWHRARPRGLWGRQFRHSSSIAPAKAADSAHFKARVARNLLDDLLKQSGHNLVFLTPQTWKSEPHPDFSIVWMPGDFQDTSQAALRLPAQLGIAFVKNRYGIRVLRTTFDHSFAALRPGVSPPIRLDISGTYKLASVPPGVRSADLVTWASKLGWDLKPLKQLWLIGCATAPPSGLLSMNQQPVLVHRCRHPGRR